MDELCKSNNNSGFIVPHFSNYEKIIICSNTMINTTFFLQIKDYYPLIIGKGVNDKPEIWFYTKIKDKIIPVIERNEYYSPQIDRFLGDNTMNFKIKNYNNGEWITFLEIDFRPNEIPEVTLLNLEPFGLRIKGDKKILKIGTNGFEKNTINGDKVFISLQ